MVRLLISRQTQFGKAVDGVGRFVLALIQGGGVGRECEFYLCSKVLSSTCPFFINLYISLLYIFYILYMSYKKKNVIEKEEGRRGHDTGFGVLVPHLPNLHLCSDSIFKSSST